MLARAGVIYEREGLNGNSDVGQASEFPLRSSKFPRLIQVFRLLLVIFFLSMLFPTVSQEASVTASAATVQTIPSPVPTPVPVFTASPIGLYDLPNVVDSQFSLYIPEINAKGKVFANVDPTDMTGYMQVLAQGIAHTKGTGLPGEPSSSIFMFAHSTDIRANIEKYNALFFDLRLLKVGDQIEVFYQNKKYTYVVYDRKIVEPDDTQYLVSKNPDGFERLILQTCWPPGTRLKRVLVFGKRVTG